MEGPTDTPTATAGPEHGDGPGLDPCALAPGTLVGARYLVRRRLGGGGFGTVYEATDARLGARVALKLIHRSLVGGERAERLRRETLTGQRAPEGFVRVHHLDWWDGAPFLVMDYAEGESLKERLGRDRPMAPDDVIQLGAALAAALERLHARGLVHRDVKPGNVILTPDGTPLLCDLGLARSLSGEHSVTDTGVAVGTPGYMAPEVASGGALTDRADVYGLGRTLQACLDGLVPERAPLPGAEDRAAEPAPRWLRRLLARATDPDPGRRPDAGTMARALERRRFVALPGRGRVAAAATTALAAGAALAAVLHGPPPAPPRTPLATLQQLQEQLEPMASAPVLAEVGQTALDYLDSLPPERIGEAERLAWVDALRLLGDAQRTRGLLDDAETRYRAALDLARPHGALDEPTGEWSRRAWVLRLRLADVAVARNDYVTAQRRLSHARCALEGFENARLRPVDFGELLSCTYSRLAATEAAFGDEIAAESLWRQEVAACDRDENATFADIAACKASPLFTLAGQLRAIGKIEDAKAALADGERCVADGLAATPWHRELLLAKVNGLRTRGLLQADARRWSDAIAAERSSIKILEQLRRRDPDDQRVASFLISQLSVLGWIENASGGPRTPDLGRRMLELSQALVESDPENRTFLLDFLIEKASHATALVREGQPEAALRLFHELNARSPSLASGPNETDSVLHRTSVNLEAEGRLLASLARDREALPVLKVSVENEERRLALSATNRRAALDLAVRLSRFALASVSAGHESEATTAARRAVRLTATRELPESWYTRYCQVLAHVALAEAEFAGHHPAASRRAARQALDIVGPGVTDLSRASGWDVEVAAMAELQLGHLEHARRMIEHLREVRFFIPEMPRFAAAHGLELPPTAPPEERAGS